jgi:lipopolysaccharide export system permease protein
LAILVLVLFKIYNGSQWFAFVHDGCERSEQKRTKANKSEQKRTKANKSEQKRTKANKSEQKRTKANKSEMLTLIDKYIIKKYLSTFFFVVLIFTAISTVIDFSEKIDNYIKEPCTKQQIIFDYTINFILYINGMLMPIYALVAVIFFTSRMANDSEMISILNAGVPFKRILRPYLIAGGIITTILIVMGHFIIPNGNKKRLDFVRKYISKNLDKGKKDNVHVFLNAHEKAYVRYFRPADTVMRDLRIETIKDGKITALLEAVNVQWKGKPNKWQLQDYQIRTFDGMKESIYINRQSRDTTFNIYPEDFFLYDDEKEAMNSIELLSSISEERLRGAFNPKNLEIEFHRRTAEPFTIIILTILGLAIAGRKTRGGIGLQLAIGIGLGAVYVFLSKLSATFATSNDTPAMLGVWFPNILFAIIAYYFTKNAQQ